MSETEHLRPLLFSRSRPNDAEPGPQNSRPLVLNPRIVIAAIVATALLLPVPFILDAHWMLIDDQLVVASRLWPLDSPWQASFHEAGRDLVALGLYFKTLALAFGLSATAYYAGSYGFLHRNSRASHGRCLVDHSIDSDGRARRSGRCLHLTWPRGVHDPVQDRGVHDAVDRGVYC